MLDLLYKGFKLAVTNTSKQPKESMSKRVKGKYEPMSCQIKNPKKLT